MCGCNISWLIRDDPALLFQVNNGTCSDGRPFQTVPVEEVSCCTEANIIPSYIIFSMLWLLLFSIRSNWFADKSTPSFATRKRLPKSRAIENALFRFLLNHPSRYMCKDGTVVYHVDFNIYRLPFFILAPIIKYLLRYSEESNTL